MTGAGTSKGTLIPVAAAILICSSVGAPAKLSNFSAINSHRGFVSAGGTIFDMVVSVSVGAIHTGCATNASQGGGYGTDKHLARLMKELTLVYGYRDIAFLDAHGLRVLVAESAPVVQNA